MNDHWEEQDLIRLLANNVDTGINFLGHNEDAVAVKIGEDFLVLNIDGWVHSTDRPPELSLFHCGVRAVANSLSDVYAKGARPTGFAVSYTLPRTLNFHSGEDDEGKPIDAVQQLVEGIKHAAEKFGVSYTGGDINEGKDLVVDVVSWGLTDRVIPRKNASEGELVCWVGPALGLTSAALGILVQGWLGDHVRALEIMGDPELFPQFLSIPATSAIDCSDGLARTLHLLAHSADLGIDLDGNVQIDPWVDQVAKENEIPLTDLIFFGGEELGIVFTCPPDTQLPDDVLILGRTKKGKGVYLGDEEIPDRGWDHFS